MLFRNMSHAYIHGSSDEERQRLTLMNDLINAKCLRELHLQDETSIVDFGSGLGQFTCAMARALREGSRVVGIERDPNQIARAGAQARAAGAEGRVVFRQGDVSAPPLEADEWGRFDLAHSRFLLEHHPDPAGVVQQMLSAVRPGGRIVLADDDHELLRLWPEASEAMSAWRAYVQLYEVLGTDAFVGRRLVALLHGAGARPQRNTYVFYGACASEPHFAGLVDNLVGVLAGARDAVVQAQLMTPAAYDAGTESLRAWKRRPDAALWYAINWAEGTRPG